LGDIKQPFHPVERELLRSSYTLWGGVIKSFCGRRGAGEPLHHGICPTAEQEGGDRQPVKRADIRIHTLAMEGLVGAGGAAILIVALGS
jgi:hypothetical protein